MTEWSHVRAISLTPARRDGCTRCAIALAARLECLHLSDSPLTETIQILHHMAEVVPRWIASPLPEYPLIEQGFWQRAVCDVYAPFQATWLGGMKERQSLAELWWELGKGLAETFLQ